MAYFWENKLKGDPATPWSSSVALFKTTAGALLAWGATDPTDQGYAPGALSIDYVAGAVKYNSGTKTAAVWSAFAGASLTLQQAFANGKVITGATTLANAFRVGNGTDGLCIWTEAVDDVRIDSYGGGTITLQAAGDNTAIGGSLVVGTTLVSTGDFSVASGPAKFTVAAATGNTVVSGSLQAAGAIGFGASYNKFTVAAATGNTAIAGDLTVAGGCAVTGNITGTFTGVWGGSAWNANPTITVADGAFGLKIDGDAVTTGDILRLEADASLTSGYFIQCLGTGTGSTSVFKVAADGAVTVKGTAAGSDAITITAGDLKLTSGHIVSTAGNLTLSAGVASLTPAGVGSSALALTGAGARSAALVSLTDTPNNGGPTFDINVTPGHGNGMVFDIDVTGTSTAPIFDLAFAGAYACTGGVVNLNMTNAVGSVGINVTGAGTRTQPLVKITDTGDNGGGAISIAATSTNAASYGLKIAESGTVANNLIALSYGAASTGDAINVTMNSAAVGAQALVISTNVAHTSPTVSITTVGGAGGNAISIASTSASTTGHGLAITESGTVANNLISLAYGGASTGDAINILMTNAAAGAQGIVFTSAVAHTSPNVSLTSANGAAATLYMSNGSTDAAGHGISILQHGAGANNAINIAYDAASTGDAINIAMNGADAAAQAIVITSNVISCNAELIAVGCNGWVGADDTGMVHIGTMVDDFISVSATMLLITYSGNAKASGAGTCLRIVDTGGTATAYAAYISSTTGEALFVDTGKAKFTESATFKASNVCYLAPNYVAAGGGPNDITATLTDSDVANVTLAAGLELYVNMGATTLQAGANTLALNGGAAKAIKKSTAPTVDKAVISAANSIVHLVYNGTSWLDMSE